MKIEAERLQIVVVAETPQDVALLEDTLGMQPQAGRRSRARYVVRSIRCQALGIILGEHREIGCDLRHPHSGRPHVFHDVFVGRDRPWAFVDADALLGPASARFLDETIDETSEAKT